MAEADPAPLRFAGLTLDPAARTLMDASGREIPLRRSGYEPLRASLAASAAAAPLNASQWPRVAFAAQTPFRARSAPDRPEPGHLLEARPRFEGAR